MSMFWGVCVSGSVVLNNLYFYKYFALELIFFLNRNFKIREVFTIYQHDKYLCHLFLYLHVFWLMTSNSENAKYKCKEIDLTVKFDGFNNSAYKITDLI